MAAITVRNISDETHRALKARAAQHGRSTEAEIRDILEKAAKPERRVKLGSLLADIGAQARLSAEEQDIFETALQRDRTAADPVIFD